MVDLLAESGFTVTVIDNLAGGREENLAHHSDNESICLVSKDIRELEPDDPLFGGSRYVFHFAGIGDIVPSIERPIEYMDVNIQGTVRVLECARAAGVEKFVYAASSSCYGLAETPTDEQHPIDPKYPYALSKYLGEQTCFHWCEVYGLPVNSIRIFNAFGPRSRTSGAYGAVFGVFLRQKLAGEPLTVVGDGTQSRDFVYVTDVARAFFAAAQTPLSGKVWNLGGNNPQTVNRLVELLDVGEVVHIPRRPGEPDITWADTARIEADLDWKPLVSFEDGVARMMDEIEYWREAPLWSPDSIAEATRNWFRYMDGSDHA
jgi:UDP-glucose 4-epimerase